MVQIKCETVDDKRKVSVHDGTSLVYAVEAPLSGKATENKIDVVLLFHTRNELRRRHAEVDAKLMTKLKELGANVALEPFVEAIMRQIDVAKLKEMEG